MNYFLIKCWGENMKNYVNSNFLKRALAGSIAFGLTISSAGCDKKADCYKPERHIHKYVENVAPGITIEAWFESENINLGNFKRTEESMNITYKGGLFFNELIDYSFIYYFLAETNWKYLYYLMSSKHDYLEFFWENDYVTYTEDDDGNKIPEHHHDEGWSKNPKHSYNNGLVRVVHHRFYAHEIIFRNGEYIKIRSPYVDDIREVLDNYHYVDKDCYTKVLSNNYKRKVNELPKLTVNDFPRFNGPKLEYKDYHLPNIGVNNENSLLEEQYEIKPFPDQHTLSPAKKNHTLNAAFSQPSFFYILSKRSNLNVYNTTIACKTLKRKYH